MAGGGNQLPAFDEIIKRGSATEPRSNRPKPKVFDPDANGDLSLHAEVEAAKFKKANIFSNEPKEHFNESGFSSDSSRGNPRKRTPMTMPRTKITAATPLEQKIGLNLLKQKLDFGEKKKNKNNDLSTQPSSKNTQMNTVLKEMFPVDLVSNSSAGQSEMSDINIGKMSERLDQVRDFLKQATSMYVSLSTSNTNDPKRLEQMGKLAKLIQQLRVQEHGYLELFQKTMTLDESVTADESTANNSESGDVADETKINQVNNQQQEIERLREQQALLKKIVEQQKELQQLKERQAALLQMQQNAEKFIPNKKVNVPPNNERKKISNEAAAANSAKSSNKRNSQEVEDAAALLQADAAQKRLLLESKLMSLQAKKDQMDKAMNTLRALKNGDQNDGNKHELNRDDLDELTSEFASSLPSVDETTSNKNKIEKMSIEEKILQLNDVKERLQELRGIVTEYEAMSGLVEQKQKENSHENNGMPTKQNKEYSRDNKSYSRDNRIHAQAMLSKEVNTLTGLGGARLRIPNTSQQQHPNNLDFHDNRKRPPPQKNEIDVQRNPPSPKHKNTNQEIAAPTLLDFEALLKDFPPEYQAKIREIQELQKYEKKVDSIQASDIETEQQTDSVLDDNTTEKESDAESNVSSSLQWPDSEEFNTKVKKLQQAKDKLNHLQQLVKVVQQGGGPHLPVEDLENLALTLSEDANDFSEYGESEEEAEGESCEDEASDEELQNRDGDDGGEDKSEISKSTDQYFSGGVENGMSDNERRYQGLLRKQRLELNYLLKERERLLEAQKKLSAMATQPADKKNKKIRKGTNSKTKKVSKDAMYPVLTKEHLEKQKLNKSAIKEDFLSKVSQLNTEDPFADYFSPTVDSTAVQSEVQVAMPLTNPLAVSEIRRQRDLFEQKKKQKLLDKQRKKKKLKRNGGGNQSDDRATYSIHSDLDEGVGFSMHSADVTTAATWGGSTEQTSSEDEDSAVGESYAATGDMQNIDDDEDDEDVYGSHFEQAEEEEEIDGVSNIPPIFKKYDDARPRRGITWYQNDVTPAGKKRKLDKKSDGNQGNGSVTWSLDVSPPRSRRKPKQRNLTPAHKLIQDQQGKRNSKSKEQKFEERLEQPVGLEMSQHPRHNEELSNQLASMCTSLLRNEQTLLSMLQSNTCSPSRFNMEKDDTIVLKNINEYFATSNYKEGFGETLSMLKTCYERVQQYQLDMNYLNSQFSKLYLPTSSNTASSCEKSPWPEPPSLHMSSLNGNTKQPASNNSTTLNQTFKPKKLSYPKETQTETSLFEDPFKPSIKPYTLFGKESQHDSPIISPSKKENNDFIFDPLLEVVSPGAVGERSFTHPYEIPTDSRLEDEELRFPYRLRISEYNPLSYQGNFANTSTGNVITMSRMSMSKDHAETNLTTRPDRIWPSFFKLTGAVCNEDESSEKSLKENEANEVKSSLQNEISSSSAAAAVSSGAQVANSTDGGSSLFETLRDSIYSEVATLIAMNESRPHFLIELFRELQLLNSDYLRQRALYALQELVTRFLTDENSPKKSAFKQETLPENIDKQVHQWIESESEQTPSESVMTTDDEGEAQALQSLARQIQNNEMYDYAEVVESQSESGTSNHTSSHLEPPFAAEDLGNTVINLDEALQKMRTYEQNMVEAKKAFTKISNNLLNSTPNEGEHLEKRKKAAFDAIKMRMGEHTMDTMSSSSAGDVGSETSSDMPHPSVDTQKLDQQIKAVMSDLIPLLNERINNVCTDSFLDEIRNLIFLCAKPNDASSEKEQFGRFFFSQLDSILKDSLMKFSGRTLKECGSDLLIDVSEILFNEMAFYKLMQDLDRPLQNDLGGGVLQNGTKNLQDNGSEQKSKMPFANTSNIENDLQSACQSIENLNERKTTNSNSSSSSSNAFVMIDSVGVETDEETESSRHFVKVELSQSESQPVRSSGSGEEDNSEEIIPASQQQQLTSSVHLYSRSSIHEDVAEQPAVENEAAEDDANIEDERDEGDQQQESARDDVSHETHAIQNNAHILSAQNVVENEHAEDERNLDGVLEDENVEGQERIRTFEGEEEERAEDDLPEADMISEASLDGGAHLVLAHMHGQQEMAGENDGAIPPNQ